MNDMTHAATVDLSALPEAPVTLFDAAFSSDAGVLFLVKFIKHGVEGEVIDANTEDERERNPWPTKCGAMVDLFRGAALGSRAGAEQLLDARMFRRVADMLDEAEGV
jgi:hypothetical protein